MTDEQPKATSRAESIGDVEHIRDIIFGAQMREYEQQFQNARRDLERLQREIDGLADRLADQDSSQNKKLQDLRREMRKADDGLRHELRETSQKLTDEKVDRAVLGELFIELGTHLKEGGSIGDLLRGLGGLEQD